MDSTTYYLLLITYYLLTIYAGGCSWGSLLPLLLSSCRIGRKTRQGGRRLALDIQAVGRLAAGCPAVDMPAAGCPAADMPAAGCLAAGIAAVGMVAADRVVDMHPGEGWED